MFGRISFPVRARRSKRTVAVMVLLTLAMLIVPGASLLAGHSTEAAATGAAPSAMVASTTPVVYSSLGINASSIFSSIWGLAQSFGKSILTDFENLIGTIFSGFGNSISSMFGIWANSFYSTGIWAPVVFVVVISLAGFIAYAFMDGFGIEKDTMEDEDDLP